MIEEGIIVETYKQIAKVRFNKSIACVHCKVGCIESGGSMIAEAQNPLGAKVGDNVRLELNSKLALRVILIVLGFPLLMLVLGVIVTNLLISTIYGIESQIISITGGILLLILAFIPVKIYERHVKNSGHCSLTIVEIINSADQNLPE